MKWILPVAILLFLPWGKANGFYPLHCSAKNAEADYEASDEIVIARVIKLERMIEDEKEEWRGKVITSKFVIYSATLKVGRSIKGELKSGDEFVMFEGGYEQKVEDNTEPTWVRQFMSHHGAGLTIDRVCLLFLKKHPRPPEGKSFYYSPTSCHFSIHSLASVLDEKTEKWSTLLLESEGANKENAGVPVEEFLTRKKAEAEKAKNEKEK